MHNVTILRVSAKNIRNNLAESLWEDTFVNVLDSVVHILFGSTHASHHISVVVHNSKLNPAPHLPFGHPLPKGRGEYYILSLMRDCY
jgi:hypothetical protein